MKKNPNGEGTIYKETRTIKGKEYSTWVVEAWFTNASGLPKRRRIRRSKQSEAQEQLQRLRDRIRSGAEAASDRKKTVRAVLEEWLQESAQRVRSNTYRQYKGIIETHLLPRIGALRAHLFTKECRIRLMDGMKAHGNSDRVRRLAYIIAKSAIGPYVRHLDPPDHPFPPKSAPKVTRRKMRVWETGKEALRFLRAARTDRHYALYLTAITTGMRQGEILALRWCDVTETQISVCGTMDPRSKTICEPKTAGSRRSVAIGPELYAALMEHRENMKAEDRALCALSSHSRRGKRAGVARPRHRIHVGPEDLVFPNEIGKPIHPSNLYRRSFKPLMGKAKVKRIRFHDMRHVCATLLLLAKVHPKIVSERLGHASIKTTLDIYAHVIPSMQADAAAAMSEILVPLVPPQVPPQRVSAEIHSLKSVRTQKPTKTRKAA